MLNLYHSQLLCNPALPSQSSYQFKIKVSNKTSHLFKLCLQLVNNWQSRQPYLNPNLSKLSNQQNISMGQLYMRLSTRKRTTQIESQGKNYMRVRVMWTRKKETLAAGHCSACYCLLGYLQDFTSLWEPLAQMQALLWTSLLILQ